jgi:hypothetical protein
MTPRKADHRSHVANGSPLARYIHQAMETNGWSLADLVRNAARRQISVADETIRKALIDGYKTPLRDSTVDKLAASLGVDRGRIRDLDSQRWNPRSEAPVASGLDPELAATLAALEPAQVQRVIDFARGIQANR